MATDEVMDAACLAVRRGAAWLRLQRHYQVGWGYNERSGADADSTAWAIRAIRAAGSVVDPADRDFLISHWDSSGGVRTFLDGPGGWSRAHSEVTAAAVLAVGPSGADQVRDSLRYSRRIRLADGSWPAYWWRTTHLATLLHVQMLVMLGCRTGDERPVVSERQEQQVTGAFDLACVAATAALSTMPTTTIALLAQELVNQQSGDGSWDSSPSLRLTDPGSGAPSSPLQGRLYADQARIYTTATAVSALARCLS
ncbi:hypothetical protein [Nocardioides endophyticus]|uniref:hypothetical protein n=1 Tax=Nocardioides endophyticus TaxID=1353775 RepID=UPI0031F11DD7